MADGQGTLFAHILKSCQKGQLNAEVLALITSKPTAPVLQKAKKHKVPAHVLCPKDFSSFSAYDRALSSCLCQIFKKRNKNAKKRTMLDKNTFPPFFEGWIVLAGFLKKIGPHTLSLFKGRMINIHPSLLPRHGGQGMYGLHVHRAVIQAGDKKTGISVHLVSKEYDQGLLLAQKEISVSPKDSPQSLQAKVKKKEPAFYVATLKKILPANSAENLKPFKVGGKMSQNRRFKHKTHPL